MINKNIRKRFEKLIRKSQATDDVLNKYYNRRLTRFEVYFIPLFLKSLDIITTYMFISFGIKEINYLGKFLINIGFELFAVVFMMLQLSFNIVCFKLYNIFKKEKTSNLSFIVFYDTSLILYSLIPIWNFMNLYGGIK